MGQKMTWEEMKRVFPDEWVALVNYNSNTSGNIDGEVIFHLQDKSAFYKHIGEILPQYDGIAIRYTGELIKNAEIPLLWQISHTA
jgi:hypothetical protein